jgi:3-oxoacyl-[acyl-carrier-protein] synthase-3
MTMPATASLLATALGAEDAAAFDLAAACSGFVYGLAQAYGALASGLGRRALVVGTEVLSRILNWEDRSTCVLFGDGAGAAVLETVGDGGFVGFELGSDGTGGHHLCIPAGGSRSPATEDTVAGALHTFHMNGQEIFRFGTRVLVSSAEKLLAECGTAVGDVDVYVPHQANKRIIDHAVRHLGLDPARVVVNLDRYGNTSAASIPICLDEAVDDGTIRPGSKVLMTGIGGGLSWASALVDWTDGKDRA